MLLTTLFSSNQSKTPCNLCGGTETWIIGECDRHNQPLRTVLCQTCGLAWTDPQPDSEMIQRFYEKDYRKQYKGTFKPKKKHTYRAGRVAMHRLHQLSEYLTEGSELLDLGSGGGEFVFLMQQQGLSVMGIEPNEGYAQYAQKDLGLPIQNGFISDQLPVEKSFDVITMFHVLEHLQDPKSRVGLLAQHLKEGGHLIIEVPNIEAICHYPGNCYHFAHLYHFNAETLAFFGQLNGLKCVFVDHSDYGGNVTVVLKKEANFVPIKTDYQTNANKVYDILKNHTVIRHILQPNTHYRTLKKQIGQICELVSVSKASDQKEALLMAIQSH
ncbi:MAG: Ubiquinone biosynthesis O-methyltransferase [Chlamydiae bacterium]|nr:Ubiquinone biosynthesis O-methyltransferase [Chlamydiota bacterium]